MSANLRESMLGGQPWPFGMFPLEGRLPWSERVIAAFLSANAGDLWCETAGGLALADGAVVPTWPALYGSATAQSDNAERPDYELTGWDSELPDGPDILFDDVGTMLESPDIDFEGDSTVCGFLVCDRDTGMGAAFRSAIEWDRFFAGTNGWSLLFHPTSERVIVGIGTGGAYQDAAVNTLGAGMHVYGFTADSSLAGGSQIRIWVDGVEQVLDTTSGTGMVGNFTSGAMTIGARDDGAGGLERPFNGQIRSVVVAHDIPTDAEMVMMCYALALRAGIDL